MMNEIDKAAEIIIESGVGCVLTGAGLSVESGIPPFRGESGLWTKYDPEEYVAIDAFIRNPQKVWSLYAELGYLLLDATPNPGHTAIAEIEKLGYIIGVITQNIDGLHTRAGSKRVVEYHGNSRRAICLKCHRIYNLDTEMLKDLPPKCECDAVLKPDIVFFGEMIPKAALLESQELIEKSSFILAIGTSATVYPANELPYKVKMRGGKIIEFNTEETPLSFHSDVSIFGSASKVLPELVQKLIKMQN